MLLNFIKVFSLVDELYILGVLVYFLADCNAYRYKVR